MSLPDTGLVRDEADTGLVSLPDTGLAPLSSALPDTALALSSTLPDTGLGKILCLVRDEADTGLVSDEGVGGGGTP